MPPADAARATFAAGFAPAALFAPSYLKVKDGLIELRGAVRREGPGAAKRLRKKFAANSRARPDHEIARGVPYPGNMWTRHVLIVGAVGSGKSTVIRRFKLSVSRAGNGLRIVGAHHAIRSAGSGAAKTVVVATDPTTPKATNIREIGFMNQFRK